MTGAGELTELTFTNGRTANHVLITNTGKVHYAADAATRPYHVLACNGRAMQGGGLGLSSDLVTAARTNWCVACSRLETITPTQEVTQ